IQTSTSRTQALKNAASLVTRDAFSANRSKSRPTDGFRVPPPTRIRFSKPPETPPTPRLTKRALREGEHPDGLHESRVELGYRLLLHHHSPFDQRLSESQ